ncbi:FAD dependent oxidoreductase [Planctomycetes bacterium Pan216]|uniref:FAD dependent oxidoreductase n=1 Tax=Kolteria novifilia TaxID=2527975 RepID=A0A518AYW1_9BACT|nr:FAD dependent oxidoreductase [Planctomycetes bacterium Pan216]
MTSSILSFSILAIATTFQASEPAAVSAQVCVVGGSPSGIAAAIAAKRAGAERVVLVEELGHVGGRMSETLGFGEQNRMKPASLGGLWNELQSRVAARYGKRVSTPEPHVIEKVFDDWLVEEGVHVIKSFPLREVTKKGSRITHITSSGGRLVEADVFVDATYTGDLLAKSGLTTTIGREARSTYGESLAGVVLALENPPGKVVEDIHRSPVSGFAEDGSTLLPHISGLTTAVTPGAGDDHLQCFNMYACFTNDTSNRVDLTKPDDYHDREFELLRREIKRLGRVPFGIGGGVPHGKAKINDGVPLLLHWGLVGGGDGYAQASAEERRTIWKAHRDYTRRLLWFLQHDPAVPEKQRARFRAWGLPRDEFVENGHWPWDVYIREGRRLVGDFIMTQADLFEQTRKSDAIALGSFPVDSHVVQRLASPDGKEVINEGGYLVEPPLYQIPYRALLPKRSECENLLAPVCMSTSRVAFNSLRVEPTWMLTGQAAGTAAAIAAHDSIVVHEVPVTRMQGKLRSEGITLGPR